MRLKSVVLAAAFASGCGPSGAPDKGGHGGPPGMGGMPPPEVSVVAVQPKALPVTFEYTGQTAGSREVEVRARVTGILLSRNFREGAPVAKGQSLYTIDPKPFEAAVARAEADVAAAEARLEQARRNAERLKPLLADKAVSQKEADDAVSSQSIGAADLKAAQARLVEARLSLSYTKVESPASGIAGRSQRSEGSLVSGPDVLLTSVTQIDPIWVNFGIPDNDQARIQKETRAGQLALPKGGNFEVRLLLADGTDYPEAGRLNFADVRISPQTGTRESRAELPNRNALLRPGQFVRVLLRGATRPNAFVVPQRAVLQGPQGKFVYVLDDEGKAQPRPVEAGEWSGDSWVITSGVKPGDRVIVDGVVKIFAPGTPVRVVEKPPAEKPAAEKK